jgi:hypothetical protein
MNPEPTSLFDPNGYPNEAYAALPRAQRKAMWIDTPHPSFVVASRKSHELKAKRLEQETELKGILLLSGARFLFYGRLTVCYERRKHTILIATSLRNPKDKDDQMGAKACALYRLVQGQYIVVPTNKDVRTKAFVQDMFFSTVW